LDDFENSCAAYEKASELSDDPVTLLNYAITLYCNDEPERAQKQFVKFEAAYGRAREAEADPDVAAQVELMRSALKMPPKA
ncbi:hypothetical protein B484DRAFT_392427, partial [Ochromonadaceae sp. CCMP2298]